MKRLIPTMAIMSLLLTGCGGVRFDGVMDPKGPVAEQQLGMIYLSLIIMVFVMVVVFGLFFYALFRFRRRPGQTEPPKQVEGNHKLEITWTVIPVVLLIIIAVPTVALTFNLEKEAKATEDHLQVKATAHQFWWEFEYPGEGVVTAQELFIPVGKKVTIQLSAADVIHSFWVPQLGGKLDTIVGDKNVNNLFLQADEAGVYLGKCAELCGQSHALMDFKVHAVDPDDYQAWLADMKEVPVVSADLADGAQLFADNCLVCHAIDPGGYSMGPNLNGLADRELLAGFLKKNDQTLHDWIKNPIEMKPGVAMPAFVDILDDSQINEIVNYLQALD